ncbi:MAG: hypothetical protein Q7U10_03990 [Thermodesulfovibrionia bacterium]|nr:hypothetical protein [Thermodesulfovibrionia bacterium]
MYRVALVQNQSEMAHYGYADARPLLQELEYEVSLYTADNIDSLAINLTRQCYSAIVLGSNALNDKTIRKEIYSDNFKKVFIDALNHGLGFISFHQLRISEIDNPTLSFLPKDIGKIKVAPRNLEEKPSKGLLQIRQGAENHVLLLYPNKINITEVQKSLLSFKSLPGLYWHYWDNANLADWDILVEDMSDAESRPLIIATKEASNYRIILSSLTLDWQKQRKFIQNLFIYTIEGRHNTAILDNDKNHNLSFDYLVGTLTAKKYPFRKYSINQSLSHLVEYIKNGVHHTLLVGPFVSLEILSEEIRSIISDKVATGELTLLIIGNEEGTRSFYVKGRERYAVRLLQQTEFSIQEELLTGYIDGSFWSTCESLQTLESIPGKFANYRNLVKKSLNNVKEAHDRNGSYDEVFGVTCALLWLRAYYLGLDDNDTKATINWIRDSIDSYDNREKALAYNTFSLISILKPEEEKKLKDILSNLSIDKLSEIDLIVYLKSAISISHYDNFAAILNALINKQINGIWIDLATTGSAASSLIDALVVARANHDTDASTIAVIEKSIFNAIIIILQDVKETYRSNTYYWDGKASTTVKCLHAWLKFEEMLDLPIHEVVDIINKNDSISTFISSSKTSLSVLEFLKVQNDSIATELKDTNKEFVKLKKIKLQNTLLFLFSLLFIYMGMNSTIGFIYLYNLKSLLEILKVVFFKNYSFHLGIIAIVAAYMSIPWNKVIEKIKK